MVTFLKPPSLKFSLTKDNISKRLVQFHSNFRATSSRLQTFGRPLNVANRP